MNVKIIATTFPAIALVLGVIVTLAGNLAGLGLIGLGAVFQFLWLMS